MHVLANIFGTTRKLTGREVILFSCMLFLVVSVTYVLYRVFVPLRVLEVHRHPLPVVGLHQIGGARSLSYRFDYCKFYDVHSTVLRELRQVDAPIIVSLYTSGYALPVGCDVVDIVEPLPPYIPPGRYKLRLIFTYRVNAVTIPTVMETEEFEVD